VLFAFNPAGGVAGPRGVVSFDPEGNLYSTAYQGGTSNAGGVFRLNRKNNIVRAIDFTLQDGYNPTAGVLVSQTSGKIYGTNSSGPGLTIDGTVFEIGKDGKLTVLYTFCQQPNCADGYGPYAPLTSHSGNVYGAAEFGGAGFTGFGGNGVVFEITP